MSTYQIAGVRQTGWMDSVGLFSSFTRLSDLHRKRVEVGQHKSGQLMGLYGLIRSRPFGLMQGLVANDAQIMSPVLERRRQLSRFGQLFNSLVQAQACMIRCHLFGGKFKRPAIHGACGLPVIFLDGVFSLNEGAGDCWRGVFRRAGWFGLWEYAYQPKRPVVCYVAMILRWALNIHSSDSYRDHGTKAGITPKEHVKHTAIVREGRLSSERKSSFFDPTMRAVMHKGDGHV